MAVLNTMLGPVHPEQMRVTAIHEHVMWPPSEQGHSTWLAHLARNVEQHYTDLMDFKVNGGLTVVDVSGPGTGRDLDVLVVLARSTAMNIVASTGIPDGQSALDDPDALEETLLTELTKGIGQTKIKAGLVSIAIDPSWKDSVRQGVYRAVAKAAVRSGAAVEIHGGREPAENVESLMGLGLAGERIIVGHLDVATNLDRDRHLASRGAYLLYDHIGVETWSSSSFAMPDGRRVEWVKGLVEAGLGDRVLLSCDTNCPELRYRLAERPLHTPGYLLRSFVPRLRQAGVSEENVQKILVDNPKRVLPVQ